MSEDRVDPFANLGQFKPKTVETANKISTDNEKIAKDIDRISIENGFPSREAQSATPSKKTRYNSRGARRQLNIKVNESDFDRFYRIAEENQVRSLGDLFGMLLDRFEQAE